MSGTSGRWGAGAIVALVFGVLAVVVGLLLVVLYVGSAVIARIGEPDQSLLFWYLPFLLMGGIGIVVGAALCVLAFQLRRREPRAEAGRE
jgi:hypothetical protein